MFDLPCVIFAGGKSSRMGRDKALLPFGGQTSLARYQYERLRPFFSSVHLSVDRPDKFDFDADLIVDTVAQIYAPTVGFVSAFRALDAERLFILSVDTPFVGPGEIEALLAHDDGRCDAVVARTREGRHPLCGIYRRSLLPSFETMLETGSHRLGKLLDTCRTVDVRFDDGRAFANLNRPGDYLDALARLKQ